MTSLTFVVSENKGSFKAVDMYFRSIREMNVFGRVDFIGRSLLPVFSIFGCDEAYILVGVESHEVSLLNFIIKDRAVFGIDVIFDGFLFEDERACRSLRAGDGLDSLTTPWLVSFDDEVEAAVVTTSDGRVYGDIGKRGCWFDECFVEAFPWAINSLGDCYTCTLIIA